MQFRKVLKMLGILLVLVLVALPIGLGALLYGSRPALIGTFEVRGLDQPVTIRFDANARPYVTARTLEDALFAEGWLHATHRLWQMDLFRRAGNGRLSELLGAGMIDTDKELWRIGVPQLAAQLDENASELMRTRVQRYVDGVNAAIDAANIVPPEYLLLRSQPRPWKPIDVYALGALMAFQSANNMENELLRLALHEELGDEMASLFLPGDGDREGFPYVLPPRAETAGAPRILDALEQLAAADPAAVALLPSFGFGSNGWAVAPKRSASGHALFAFDSHDSLSAPNLFYEVHLFFDDSRSIRGWSVAGLPGVINGYNERIAWGFTNIGDTQDLFVETRSEDDPLLFKDGETWYRASTETIQIPVSGRSEPIQFEIVRTINGPLISDDPPIALRWTVQELHGMGIDTILEFNLARNWAEFTDALDRFAAPSLNATYADVDGNIGFRTAGLIPSRGKGDGLVPLQGSDPGSRWQGTVDAGSMPELLNPDAGFVAAANSRVNREDDGPLVSADNAPEYRIARIQSVLSGRTDFTPDDMRRLQGDWYDGQAAILLHPLLAEVNPESFNPLERAAFEYLLEWASDPVADPQLGAPLVFQAWYRALARQVFEPAMTPDLFSELFKNNYVLNHALDQLILSKPDDAWWRGQRRDLLQGAFRNAVEEIRQRQGDVVESWRLDEMHHVLLLHELGSAVPQLALLFNLKPQPWGGSTATVGRARYRYDRAYDVTAAATVRVVGEMTNPPAMAAVMPGGQSGHPLSAQYGDQLDTWLDRGLLEIAHREFDAQGRQIELVPAGK